MIRTGAYDRFVSRYVALDWAVGRDEPGQIKMDGYGGLCLDAGNSESAPSLSQGHITNNQSRKRARRFRSGSAAPLDPRRRRGSSLRTSCGWRTRSSASRCRTRRTGPEKRTRATSAWPSARAAASDSGGASRTRRAASQSRARCGCKRSPRTARRHRRWRSERPSTDADDVTPAQLQHGVYGHTALSIEHCLARAGHFKVLRHPRKLQKDDRACYPTQPGQTFPATGHNSITSCTFCCNHTIDDVTAYPPYSSDADAGRTVRIRRDAKAKSEAQSSGGARSE